MTIWGKLVGASAGFLLGGPLGALLGGFAGHLYDRLQVAREQPLPAPPEPSEVRQLVFSAGLVALAAKLAKVDGVVTRNEIDAFREVFDIKPDEVPQVAQLYNAAKQSPHGFEAYAEQVAELLGHDAALLEELLDGLIAIAAADGRLHAAEERYLREVARIFGFGPWQFEHILARWQAAFRQTQPDAATPDPYLVLGVARDAPDEAIRQAWRQLVREHHPDRLIAEGMPAEWVKQANDKLAAINAAYDQIRKERGMA